jgi:F-type H+-transporting ATPase subunit epsilon
MSFTFDLVSPERLLLSTQVEMAEIPGEEGDMGVLEGHAPMVVQLRGGVIRLSLADGTRQEFFIGGGFAEVTQERTAVLADEAVPLGELTPDLARTRLAEAEAAWERVSAVESDPTARDAALRQLIAGRAMVDAAAR